jgi:hypothetical protein
MSNTMHQSSHPSSLPLVTPPPSMTRRPTTPLSLLTTSWKMLNQEQLAHETWTCKDPLCQRPYHLTLMGYLSTPSTETSWDSKPCPKQSLWPGAATIPTPQPCMEVSPRQQDILAPSPRHHPIAPRFIAEPRPKATTLQLHIRPPQKTFPMWCQQMAHQQLAEDTAHTLLSGVSNHLHPLSLKYRSSARSPLNAHTPDRVAEATHTNRHQQ